MHQTSTNDDNEAEADYVKARGAFEETLDAQIASNVANEQELAELKEEIAETEEIKDSPQLQMMQNKVKAEGKKAEDL